MRNGALLIVMILAAVVGYGQQPTGGEIEPAEFVIEKEKELALPVANRLFLPLRLPPMSVREPDLVFTVREPVLRLPAFEPEVKPQSLETYEAPKLYNHKLKIGIGNYLSPLLSYSYKTKDKRDFQWGGSTFHESFQSGPVRDELSSQSDNQLKLWGSYSRKAFTIRPLVTYGRSGYYFYGLSDSAYYSGQDPIVTDRVRMHRAVMSAPVAGTNPSGKLAYHLDPSVSWVVQRTTLWPLQSEGTISFSSGISYRVKPALRTGVKFGVQQAFYTSGESTSRRWIHFSPYFNVAKDRYQLKAGLDFSSVQEDSIRTYFFPQAEFDFQLAENVHVFANMHGGVVTNTFSETAEANLYLDDSLQLSSTIEWIGLDAGVRGLLWPGMSYSLAGFVSNRQNQSYIQNMLVDSSRFGRVYDTANVIIGGIQGKINYRLRNKIIASWDVRFQQFGTVSEPEAWHVPRLQSVLSVRALLTEKLIFTPYLLVMNHIPVTVMNEPLEVDYLKVVDLGFDVNYWINEKGGIFLSAKNILNMENTSYLYYPSRVFTVKAGVIYQF